MDVEGSLYGPSGERTSDILGDLRMSLPGHGYSTRGSNLVGMAQHPLELELRMALRDQTLVLRPNPALRCSLVGSGVKRQSGDIRRRLAIVPRSSWWPAQNSNLSTADRGGNRNDRKEVSA